MTVPDSQDLEAGPTSEEAEQGMFEITLQVQGATKVNRLLSWIVRSRAYDDVDGLTVTYEGGDEAGTKAG